MDFKGLRRIGYLVVAAAFVLSLAAPAQAIITIDFGSGNATQPTGTFTVVGTNATGSGIGLDTLSVGGAPVSGNFDLSGAFVCANAGVCGAGNVAAVLNFNTGVATDTTTCGSTNCIQIIGGVPALGIPNGTLLLTGTFSTSLVQNPGFGVIAVSGGGPDTKNSALLTALGIPVNSNFNFFGFSLTTGVITSTDVANSTTTTPEPTSLLLLGAGLGALGLWGRRRVSRKQNAS